MTGPMIDTLADTGVDNVLAVVLTVIALLAMGAILLFGSKRR